MIFYVSMMAAVFRGSKCSIWDALLTVCRPSASASGTDRSELEQITRSHHLCKSSTLRGASWTAKIQTLFESRQLFSKGFPVGMNRGDTVYLRLAGFKPEWRQAVVISGKPR